MNKKLGSKSPKLLNNKLKATNTEKTIINGIGIATKVGDSNYINGIGIKTKADNEETYVNSVNEASGDLTIVPGFATTVDTDKTAKKITINNNGTGTITVGDKVLKGNIEFVGGDNTTISADTTTNKITWNSSGGGSSGVSKFNGMTGELEAKSADNSLLTIEPKPSIKKLLFTILANQIDFYKRNLTKYSLTGPINFKASTGMELDFDQTPEGKNEVYIKTDCTKTEPITPELTKTNPNAFKFPKDVLTPIKGLKIDNVGYEFMNQVTPLLSTESGATVIEGFQIKGMEFKFKQPDIPTSSSNSITYYGNNTLWGSSPSVAGSDICIPINANNIPFQVQMRLSGYNPYNFFNNDVYETNASQASSYITYTKVNNLKNPTWPAIKVEWEFNQTIQMGSFVPETTKVLASLQKNIKSSSTWKEIFQSAFGTAFGLTMNDYSDFLMSGFEQTVGSLNCAGEPADNFKSNFGIVVTGNNTGTPEQGHQIFTPKLWSLSTNSTQFARIALDNNWPDDETWEPTDNMYFLSCKFVFTMEFIPDEEYVNFLKKFK